MLPISDCYLILCNPSLIDDNPAYAQDVNPNSTLDLFTQNNLWPIFTDDEITQLYDRLYLDETDKPALTARIIRNALLK